MGAGAEGARGGPRPSHGAAAGAREARGTPGSLASGTRVLSVGIASTGVFTFAYLATASHVLSPRDYGRISLAWAVMFVILSVIYRPIEQLLSRTIALRRARGHAAHPLRVPAVLQATFAGLFLVVAIVERGAIQRGMFGGAAVLWWVLVVGVVAYAGSYFARGWLAGHEAFALYGALVFLESASRFCCALAVAVGIGSGLGEVALGMALAPFVSLSVLPWALRAVSGRLRARAPLADGEPGPGSGTGTGEDSAGGPVASAAGPVAAPGTEGDLSLRHGAGFAAAVVAIMASEQALMNGGVLVVAASVGARSLDAGITGFVFDVMLIVRAPLQLFQAVQTSILPHLTALEARAHPRALRRAIRTTVTATGAFGLAVAVGLLLVGPPVMRLVLGANGFSYDRFGLALVGLGMGFHLVSGTLNQAALARGRAGRAASCWAAAAALFLAFQLLDLVPGRVTRVEVGYCGATLLLCLALAWVHRRTPAGAVAGTAGAQSAPAASASAA